MKKYVVHEIEDETITEYDTLDGVPQFDRAQFEWMLEHGEIVISMGKTVYQIRREAA